MRILVTGGAGFIGSNLARRLATSDAVTEVIALDDLSTGLASNLDGVVHEVNDKTNDDAHGKVRFVLGSILDVDLVNELMHGTTAVVHLAARPSVPRSIDDPMASHRVNVDGTMTILEAARAQRTKPHIVMSSSSSVYGANTTLPKHEDLAPLPRSPYAASKLTGESYLLAYQESFGVPALAFRLFNVFGPRQQPGHAYAAVVPMFLHAALTGEPVSIHGDGLQTRDFTYVETVAEVINRVVVGRIVSSTPVNLAFGTRFSLLDVLTKIEQIIGHRVARTHLPVRPGDVRDSQAATDRLRSLFPDVAPVGLDAGLTATLEWMRSWLEK